MLLVKGQVSSLPFPVVWVARATPERANSSGFGPGRRYLDLVLHRSRHRLIDLVLHVVQCGGLEPLPAAATDQLGS